MIIKNVENKNTEKKIIQKPAEGVTIAIIEDYLDPVLEISEQGKPLHAQIANLLDAFSFQQRQGKSLPKIKGIARCSKEDTFDPYLGESLACARADAAYHHRMAQAYAHNIKELKQAILYFEKMENYHLGKESGLRRYAKDICKTGEGA